MDINKGPQYSTRQAQGDHGVDLDKLRTQLDKLHSIPQLQAGLNGKLSRVAPKVEPRELTPAEAKEMQIKALAQCVAVAEGEWIDKVMKKIFRDDCIHASYGKRIKAMNSENLEDRAKGIEAMAKLLSEYQIEINHREPEEGYVMPEDCLLYRRLEISRAGKVRAEQVWEWSKQV
jgi:hypothetical protein